MPLYKITEKRRIKKQKEDDSGITEMKVAMGLDEESGSDESDSEDEGSGSGSGGDDAEEESEDGEGDDDDDDDGRDDDGEAVEGSASESESGARSPLKRKRESEASPDEDDIPLNEDDQESDEESLDDDIPMSVSKALENPIYPIQPPLSTCLLCPGKILKNPESIKIHLKSASHVRSFKRFAAKVEEIKVEGVDLEDVDPREVVRLCLRDVKGVKRGEIPPPAVQEKGVEGGDEQPKSAVKINARKRRGNARRDDEKLAKRRKEWEEKGKEGEFVGTNRKERRRLKAENKVMAGEKVKADTGK